MNFLKNILLSLRAELKGSRSEAFKNFTGQDSPILCVFYKSMPLRCAILAAICAVDFAAMFKDMSITAGDLATKSYNWNHANFLNLWKVLDLATRPGKPSNKAFQCFSMVHNPPLHFDLSWTLIPFSSYMERRSPYFASFVLGIFSMLMKLF